MEKREWTIEYHNDTGVNDEGFWEWWEISDGEITLKCDNEEHAKEILEILNDYQDLSEHPRMK